MDGFTVAPISYEMTEQSNKLQTFFGRRSFVPRPLSDATLIFDTEDEDDEYDLSPESLTPDNASRSSLSPADELRTPLTAGLGGFEFHFDDQTIKGPVGPHLFQVASNFEDDEEYLATSPIDLPKQQPRPFTSLNSAVAELDESQVRDWSPKQVAEWMSDAGFEAAVVEKFLIHDIYGAVLLDLQFEDLKEIDISSFGKRRQVMSSIQHLRNSSMITPTSAPISASPSHDNRSRSLARPARPEDTRAYTPRPSSRRGRQTKQADDITPAESVSIVAIEQLLPEAHECSKGEDCPKWRKSQRKIQKIKERFAAEAFQAMEESKSVAAPSVVGSSDVLGPAAMPITAELLSVVRPRDPQETVRQFLDFQHLNASRQVNGPSPPPSPSATFSAHLEQQLKDLPRLTIPAQKKYPESPMRTPISALRNPTQRQSELKTALINDPYHYGGVASPADVYRVGTPMSVTDVPATAMPVDPCGERDTSQSVPPEMRYGAPSPLVTEPIRRCVSTSPKQPRRRQPSFMPTVAPVSEMDDTSVQRSGLTSEVDLANHAGWMRKRMNARLLKHEWQDHYFNLHGSKLDMFVDESQKDQSLETIDVDDYTLHAYTVASSSKLHAAFKKSMGASNSEPKFAFSLIPEDQKDKKLFDKSKSHHFAVASGRDRVEWMRKLMLAKAIKKNDITCQI